MDCRTFLGTTQFKVVTLPSVPALLGQYPVRHHRPREARTRPLDGAAGRLTPGVCHPDALSGALTKPSIDSRGGRQPEIDSLLPRAQPIRVPGESRRIGERRHRVRGSPRGVGLEDHVGQRLSQSGVARVQAMLARPEDVVVIEVPSDFVVPANLRIDLHARWRRDWLFERASFWSVFIDKDQCSGLGYDVYASRWKTIPQYPHIILGHELAHVSHYLQGTPTSEPLATTAENTHRAELGLPLRSVTKYSGGCGEGPRRLPPWLQEWAGES